MRLVPVFGLVVIVSGCRATTGEGAQPTPSPSGQGAPGPMIRISAVESFTPSSGDAALRAFVPEALPVDSGGECRVMRTSGSGATMVSAYFPSFDSARTVIHLSFDSAGNLVRFGDSRGMVRYRGGRNLSAAQLDSARRTANAAVRSTSISLDYAMDQGLAVNSGGGKSTEAVIGTVRAVEILEKLGPPTKRLKRARSLCGV